MAKITSFFFYLLAFFLAFGSVNPFDLDSVRNVSEAVSTQDSLSPFLFVACSILSLFDPKVFKRISSMGRYYVLLLVLIFSIFMGDVLYNTSGPAFEALYYAKLLIATFGFMVFSIYFTEHLDVLRFSLILYGWVCVAIVCAYFIGLFDQYSFYSKGRLWLFGENPNSFSFLMGLGALIHLSSFLEGRKNKVIHFLSVLIIVFFIVLTGSRGSFIICLLSMVILALPYLKRNAVASAFIAIIVIGVSGFFIQSLSDQFSFVDRMGSLSQEDDRRELLVNSFSLFLDRPLFGYGRFGYLTERLLQFQDNRDSHNIIVSVLAMGGVVGGVAIILFLSMLFFKAKTAYKHNVFSLSLFIYMFLISLKTGEILSFSMMWYVFAVVFSSANISIKTASEQ